MPASTYTIEVIESAPFGQNAFVLWQRDRTDAIAVDPGFDDRSIIRLLQQENRKLAAENRLVLDQLTFLGQLHGLDETNSRKRSRDWCDRLQITEAIDKKTEELSKGMQQKIQFIAALLHEPDLIIMDEPTAPLDDRETESLFRSIRVLRSRGAGVIYISHRLNEIFSIADRITVLRDGETIGTRNTTEIQPTGLIEMMAGRPSASVFPTREVPHGAIALELRSVSSSAAGVRDVSFSVRSGEIVGLAGLVGSGRTELAETIFGLNALDSGEILVVGEVSGPNQFDARLVEAALDELPCENSRLPVRWDEYEQSIGTKVPRSLKKRRKVRIHHRHLDDF